jgi:hypothetical protein
MGNLNNALQELRAEQAGAVACGEIGSSDFSDRVVKRFGNIRDTKPTDPNYIRCITASPLSVDNRGFHPSTSLSLTDLPVRIVRTAKYGS